MKLDARRSKCEKLSADKKKATDREKIACVNLTRLDRFKACWMEITPLEANRLPGFDSKFTHQSTLLSRKSDTSSFWTKWKQNIALSTSYKSSTKTAATSHNPKGAFNGSAGQHLLEHRQRNKTTESFPDVQNPSCIVCRRFYSVVCFAISFPILVHGKIASKNVLEQKKMYKPFRSWNEGSTFFLLTYIRKSGGVYSQKSQVGNLNKTRTYSTRKKDNTDIH